MSNLQNENEWEKTFLEIEKMDERGELEADIQLVSKTYGLHEDDDRDEILFFIAEMIYEHNLYNKTIDV
jgi:hypothetical protein